MQIEIKKNNFSLVDEDGSFYTSSLDIADRDIKKITFTQIEAWAIEHAKHQFSNCDC